MSKASDSLPLEPGDTDVLLHILWMRLVLIVSEYQHLYSEDIEITTIQRLSEQLGERFSIVLDNGVSKVAPRRG